MKRYYQSPLSIYVVWHPDFEEGKEYAQLIYDTFCRDSSKPLSRGIGIPVFFRNKVKNDGSIQDIPFEDGERNCIIVLIDESFFNDMKWCTYITEIAKKCDSKNRIFPLSFTEYSHFIDEAHLGKIQALRLENIKKDEDLKNRVEERWKDIKAQLLHDCIRMMYDFSTVSDADFKVPPPAKLFISHAKYDGTSIAIQFRDYLRAETKLASFFDVNDIADGYNFEQQIKDGARESALVVFKTDEYSDREWCRIEVLSAKRHLSPLLVVNCITKGEKRSFPYMGNCPTIRLNNCNFNEIINAILRQVLHNVFQKELMDKYESLYQQKIKKYKVIKLAQPPELFNFIDINNEAKRNPQKQILVLYSEPPLGLEELAVLNEFDEKIKFYTPITLSQI